MCSVILQVIELESKEELKAVEREFNFKVLLMMCGCEEKNNRKMCVDIVEDENKIPLDDTRLIPGYARVTPETNSDIKNCGSKHF